MAGRRANHEGTTYYDADRGRWRGEVTLGRRPDGRPDTRKVSADSKAAALKLLRELRLKYERGLLGTRDQERQTFGALVERFLLAKAGRVRPPTLRRYRQLLGLHLVPHLGRTPLAGPLALRPDQIEAAYAAARERGLGPRTTRFLHRTLVTVFRQAVRWGDVTANVMERVSAPVVPAEEVTPPTAPEVVRILAAAEGAGDPLACLWTVIAYTGLRRGEALGLRWEDADLESGALHVRRSLIGVQTGAPIFSLPKTARSRRRVPLNAPAVVALRAHRAAQNTARLKLGEGWGMGIAENLAGGGLVFATATGAPVSPDDLHRPWGRALARAGFAPRPTGAARFRVHDLRHAAATQMLANGVDVATVSAILGHSSPAITYRVYAHAIPDRLALGTDALARAFGG